MHKRQPGKSGLDVSALGFDCMGLTSAMARRSTGSRESRLSVRPPKVARRS